MSQVQAGQPAVVVVSGGSPPNIEQNSAPQENDATQERAEERAQQYGETLAEVRRLQQEVSELREKLAQSEATGVQLAELRAALAGLESRLAELNPAPSGDTQLLEPDLEPDPNQEPEPDPVVEKTPFLQVLLSI